MTDQTSGLRFDIYERVHLPDEVAAIEELEEIELVPHMQALNQADQLLLKGHLLLTGIYRSAEQRGTSSKLEHWIPVEISLPPNRVQRMEDLNVEIDNFDIDLLSTRSLNVTGVLALRGVHTDAPQPPVWRDDSFTVVHQARSETPPPNAAPGEAAAAETKENEPNDFVVVAEPSDAQGHGADEEENDLPEAELPTIPASAQYETEYAAPPSSEGGFRETDAKPAADQLLWASDVGWGDITERQQEDGGDRISAYGNANELESRPEVKIALGIKNDGPSAAGGEWLSLLGEKRSEAKSEAQAAQKAEGALEEDLSQGAKNSSGDELEWKSLFLSAGADPEAFCKVRMCIVQREDTLEGIAARYNIQPRELQLRNRLGDPYLSEGQVLYIP